MSIIAGAAAASGGFARGAKVVKNVAGSLGNHNNVPTPWDAEDYDNDSHWASSPNPERLTIGAGYDAVMLGSTVWFNNLASTRLRSAITVNGSIVDDGAVYYTEPIGFGSDPASNVFTGPIDVGASTDWYTVVHNTADTSWNYKGTGNFWMMVLPT
jgi:hypothetical protein